MLIFIDYTSSDGLECINEPSEIQDQNVYIIQYQLKQLQLRISAAFRCHTKSGCLVSLFSSPSMVFKDLAYQHIKPQFKTTGCGLLSQPNQQTIDIMVDSYECCWDSTSLERWTLPFSFMQFSQTQECSTSDFIQTGHANKAAPSYTQCPSAKTEMPHFCLCKNHARSIVREADLLPDRVTRKKAMQHVCGRG